MRVLGGQAKLRKNAAPFLGQKRSQQVNFLFNFITLGQSNSVMPKLLYGRF